MAEAQMTVMDGGDFYAHEATLNFTPLQIVLDFKSVTPRTDPRGKGKPSFVLRHNVILLDPWHAKKVSEVFNNVIKKYEEEFGEIKKPKSLEKAEKKHKQSQEQTGDPKTPVPTYMG